MSATWRAMSVGIGRSVVPPTNHHPVRVMNGQYPPGTFPDVTAATPTVQGGGTAPPSDATAAGAAPDNARLVLASLIVVATVANLNLTVANVALPYIGKASTRRRRRSTSSPSATPSGSPRRSCGSVRSETATAASCMIVLGMCLSVPASHRGRRSRRTTACSFVARVVGGLSAGMAYPTTLALITALWSGAARTQVDRALVGDRRRYRRLGPLIAGT